MSKHDFLSEAWVEAARAIQAEYEGKISTSPPPMRMNVVVTDVPFQDGEMAAHIDTTTGEMALDLGHLDGPDLTVTVDYGTAKAIFVLQDPQAGMQAFMAGKIKVQGDMTKMMAMQTVQPDPLAAEMSTKIAEITA